MLGPQGSAKLIEAVHASPGADAAAMFPEAAGANKPIFYHGGRPATVAQVYANLTSNRGAAPVTVAPEGPPDQGLIEFASARRVVQMQEEQALIGMLLRTPGGSGDLGVGMQTSNSLFSNEMLQALSQTPKA
jgi:UDP-N-acetyl-D-mannosaminuronic acid transferase (WecB/TagA/CpsF family)